MIALANSYGGRTRSAAACALAENSEPWAAEVLTALLADPQQQVRAVALLSLARVRGEKHETALAWAQQHPNPDIRHVAEELQQLSVILVISKAWFPQDMPGGVVGFSIDE